MLYYTPNFSMIQRPLLEISSIVVYLLAMFTESLVKIIESKRSPLGRIKVETPVHHPRGTTLVADTIAGPIFRISLPPTEVCWTEDLEMPEFLNKITTSAKSRKALAFALHTNSKRAYDRECNKAIGKPNSAFIALKNTIFIIDHLFENQSFEREDESKLHGIIRSKVNYKDGFQPIQKDILALSGHLAPINISTKSAAYIMLLDHFMGENSYQNTSLEFQRVIRLMYGSRIIPVTSDGYLMKLDSKG